MLAALVVLLVSLGVIFKALGAGRRVAALVVFILIAGIALEGLFPQADWLAASLQTGLLDPISLIQAQHQPGPSANGRQPCGNFVRWAPDTTVGQG